MVNWTLANSDGTPLDAAVFTSQLNTDPFTLTVHNMNDASKAAIYSLKLTASYVDFPTIFDEVTFTSAIENDCKSNAILSSPTILDQSYQLGEPVKFIPVTFSSVP